MRKLFIILLILCSFEVWAQKKPIADIQPARGVDSTDIINFMDLLELESSKYTISQKFKNYYCNVIIQEYRKGQLINSYNVRDSINKMGSSFDYTFSINKGSKNGKFVFAIYSQRIADSLLKIYSRLGSMGFHYKFKLDKGVGYHWKEVFNQPSEKHELKPGEPYPLLAYSKAVGEAHAIYKGSEEFCRVSGEFVPFQDWYKELGIEHYFIVFIKLEK